MKKLLPLALVLMLTAMAGCAPRALAPATPVPMPARGIAEEKVMEAEAPAAPKPEALPSLAERMIIRRAELSLTVKDTEESLAQLKALAAGMGGYTVDSHSWREDDRLHAALTIRVPADSFEEAMEHLRSLAVEVRSESTSGEDVTEEYTDLESRLRNLEAAEAQLLKIMEEAEKTEDVLAVYKELIEIRGQIEQTKGRMQYLERMSAMATIHIELTLEKAIVEPGWRPLRTLRSASRALVTAARFIADAAIWGVIFLLPLLAIPVLLIWLAWRQWRERRENEPMSNDQ